MYTEEYKGSVGKKKWKRKMKGCRIGNRIEDRRTRTEMEGGNRNGRQRGGIKAGDGEEETR